MDKTTEAMVRDIVRNDIGDLISHELEVRFKTIQKQIDTILQSNDDIAQQIKEDREDINQIRIDMAKSLTQNKVIIENQDHQEDKMVEAVEEAAEKIPEQVDNAVKETIGKKSFMDKILK